MQRILTAIFRRHAIARIDGKPPVKLDLRQWSETVIKKHDRSTDSLSIRTYRHNDGRFIFTVENRHWRGFITASWGMEVAAGKDPVAAVNEYAELPTGFGKNTAKIIIANLPPEDHR